MSPEGKPLLGVTLLGEALGESEAKHGRPFIGAAGIRLGRMIERAGYKREQFQILNAVWCRPPNNSQPPQEAIEHCKQYWEPLVKLPETKVILAMGNAPLWATLGLEGVLSKRGYVWWSDKYECFVIPTVHPSFILRGNSNWEAAFLYDLRHAVEVAAEGWEPIQREYTLDPSPSRAMAWAIEFRDELRMNPDQALACDIETPDKSAAEDETDINLGYQAGPIYRIGFAYVPRSGAPTRVLSVPWDVSYMEVIEVLLSLDVILVFANRHFDVPRIKAHKVKILGHVADVQESWHVLHSARPKKLEHIAPDLCPRQPAWKHLSSSQPAFYNGVDAAVQVESWWRVKELLTQHGMWHVYHEHIFELNPLLVQMTEAGMPIDIERRKKASQQLMVLKEKVREDLNEAAGEARPAKIYKKFREGLQETKIEAVERYCSECGKTKVNRNHGHFKCGNAEGEVPLGELCERVVSAIGFVQPLDFKPSHTGLLRYAKFKGYRLISRYDRVQQKRIYPMDENAMRRYALQHPEDKIFKLSLDERELNKLLGTYMGRLTTEKPKELSDREKWWNAFQAAQYKQPEGPKDPQPRYYSPSSVEEDDSIPF